jgi:hypothetical protein
MKLVMPGYGRLTNENKNFTVTKKMNAREDHGIYNTLFLRIKK